MSALRVACLTPWGDSHDLLVLQEHVIVPQSLGHVPSLWWLGDEDHPRVEVTLVSSLERETGTSLGRSPYCVPSERWNEGARIESWMPLVPTAPGSASLDRSKERRRPGDLQPLGWVALPRHAELHELYLVGGGRLGAGQHAVSDLSGWCRRLLVAALLGATALAVAYYLAATGLWLWSLRHGMSGRNVQVGITLLVAALVFAPIMRTLARLVTGSAVSSSGQPPLATLLGGFRMGVLLQLLAFAGFVIF
jgi:hypothetical protein